MGESGIHTKLLQIKFFTFFGQMPKTYIRKRTTAYTDSVVEDALEAVRGGMSFKVAEVEFGVPHWVLHRLGKNNRLLPVGSGSNPALTHDVEQVLEDCLIARSKMGYPCHRSEIKSLVQEYVKINNILTPFRDGLPGDDWFRGFMKRHTKLSLKKPEPLQKSRMRARDPFVIHGFFEMIGDVYRDCGITNQSASLIFNTDESGFGSDPTQIRAIGEKGRPLNRIVDGSGRESTTVLACVSANGDFLPPLIVFKGMAVQPRWTSTKQYPGTMYAANSNGWMEEETFFQWLEKMFVPHIEEVRQRLSSPDQPAILFLMGTAATSLFE